MQDHSLFSTPFPAFIVCRLVDHGHSDKCEVISPHSFDLHFSNNEQCVWTVVLEKTLETPLDYKEIQPVYPKGNQSWIVIGRTDVEAETPILWPLDAKNWLIWKDPDDEIDCGKVEKWMTEDEMVGWHHRLNGHGFGWTPEVDVGQGGLACCSPWGHKDWDMTERLNWTEDSIL